MPEHVKIEKPIGIVLDIYAHDMENLYDNVRINAKELKDDREYYLTHHNQQSYGSGVYGMFEMGNTERYIGSKTYRNAVCVRVRHTIPSKTAPYEYSDEVAVFMKYDGWPCTLHYKVAYAMVSKEVGPRGYNMLTIEFYDKEDRMVIALKQYGEMSYGEVRSKAGKYILDADIYKEKEKKKVAGGCFFCDNAQYVKDNGVIYIACAKYDGRVAEVEYTGEAYPEYCKRRV